MNDTTHEGATSLREYKPERENGHENEIQPEGSAQTHGGEQTDASASEGETSTNHPSNNHSTPEISRAPTPTTPDAIMSDAGTSRWQQSTATDEQRSDIERDEDGGAVVAPLSDDYARTIVGFASSLAEPRLFIREPRVKFFTKDSDPSNAFHTRKARNAYPVKDDNLKDSYLFLWKIGKTGQLVVPLGGSEHSRDSVRVRRVLMRVGRDRFKELVFVQEENFRAQQQIIAELDASHLQSPMLNSSCRRRGDVESKLVPLHILIEVAVGHHPTNIQDVPITIYCRVFRNRKTPLLHARQKFDEWWEYEPQATRTVMKLVPRIGKKILKLRVRGRKHMLHG